MLLFYLIKNILIHILLFLLPYYFLIKRNKKIVEIIVDINDFTNEEYQEKIIHLYNDNEEYKKIILDLYEQVEQYKVNEKNHKKIENKKTKYKNLYNNTVELYNKLLFDYYNIEEEHEKILNKIKDINTNNWLLNEKNDNLEKLLKKNQEEVMEKKYELIKLRKRTL